MRAPFLLVYCVFAQELWAAAHIDPEEGGGDLAYIHTYIKDERQQHTHVGRLLNSLPPHFCIAIMSAV